MKSLGSKIKLARKAIQSTQSQLAQAVGVSDKSVSAYESGRISPPLEVLEKIATSTRHPMQYFVGEPAESSILQKLNSIEELFTEIRDLLKEQGTRK